MFYECIKMLHSYIEDFTCELLLFLFGKIYSIRTESTSLNLHFDYPDLREVTEWHAFIIKDGSL